MTHFFGTPWDAPIVDEGVQVATPIGTACLECREVIVDGDQGFLQPLILGVDGDVDDATVVRHLARTPEARAVLTAQHRECSLLGVVGHLVGVCSCNDYAGHGDRSRSAAREAERRWRMQNLLTAARASVREA